MQSSNTHSNSNSNSNSNTYTHSNSNSNTYTNTHSNSNSYINTHSNTNHNTYTYPNTYTHTHPYSNNTNPHTNPNTSNTNSYTYPHTYPYSNNTNTYNNNTNSYTYPHTYPYSNNTNTYNNNTNPNTNNPNATHSSKNIGYVNYDDSGFTGSSFPSGNIFATSVVNGPAPTSFTNDSVTYNNMTFTPLKKADLSSATLANYDTLILFEICDISTSLSSAQHDAIIAYLAAGNKILLFDADRCAPGFGGAGNADYSWFTYPFTTSNPGPQGASGTLTIVENSTLTSGLASDPFNSDELGDANTATTNDTHWFGATNTTNALGNKGYFLAYANNSGLIIYDGADYWYTGGSTKSLTDLFLNELNQQYNPDQLPSSIPIAPTVSITANPATHNMNVSTNFTFTANPVGSWGNNISYSWSTTYDKCFTTAPVFTGQSISEYLDVACGNATISVAAEDEKNNTAHDTYLVTVHENAIPIPPPASAVNIAGFKINNATGNGVQGWNITLMNSTMQKSTMTGADGSYKFTNLANGTYNVTEEMKTGWTSCLLYTSD